MSIKTIEELKAAFSQNESSNENHSNNYYPFWQMKEGEHAIVRFLPDANENNPMGFFVEKRMHNLIINGEKKNVPCMTMYEDECPICAVSSAFYKKKDDDMGKKYWRKRQYLTQAIIVSDPLPKDDTTGENYEGKVCCIALGFQLYNIIKEATMSNELDTVPYLFENGVDFIIKKSKQGEYATYALGSKFARTNRDLTADEIAKATTQMIDLSTLLPRAPAIETIDEALAAALGSDTGSTPPASSYDTSATTAAATTAEAVADAGYDTKADDGEGGDEADAILAEIRQRKNAG